MIPAASGYFTDTEGGLLKQYVQKHEPDHPPLFINLQYLCIYFQAGADYLETT